MNIVKAKKNLLAHLHLLPEPVQADLKFLLEKFDATVRELNEIKHNAYSWNKIEDLPHEIWRDVVGYEGLYMVSNFGRVKSFYGIGEHLLTPSANRGGYMYVVLTKGTERKSHKVHTLVARAFISNPDNKPAVHHKDSNRGNNCVENLEWVTHSENTMYAVKNGSYDNKDGCANPHSKLSEEDVQYIRSHYIPHNKSFGANALARKFNVSTGTILNVVNRETYKNID